MIAYGGVTKILSTFIPAFEGAISKDSGDTVWLHGNFNLGGTVSGRLSSSEPNMQNIPAGSEYGKVIKACFSAPEGWLFCGADFNALEMRINALLTKDPNKVQIYTAGLDSHSWNTLGYWPERMADIADAVHRASNPGKFLKVTYEDGSVNYFHEGDPNLPQLPY